MTGLVARTGAARPYAENPGANGRVAMAGTRVARDRSPGVGCIRTRFADWRPDRNAAATGREFFAARFGEACCGRYFHPVLPRGCGVVCAAVDRVRGIALVQKRQDPPPPLVAQAIDVPQRGAPMAAPISRPIFDAASVKATPGTTASDWIRPKIDDSTRFQARTIVEQLIEWAYGVREFQIVGAGRLAQKRSV